MAVPHPVPYLVQGHTGEHAKPELDAHEIDERAYHAKDGEHHEIGKKEDYVPHTRILAPTPAPSKAGFLLVPL